jgi:o-succinylbenzoate synthase
MRLALDRFSLPLARPLSTANGDVTEREGFVVTVATEGTDRDGHGDPAGDDVADATDGDRRGVGEATPLPGWTESLADCERALRTAAAGLPDAAPATALDALDDVGGLDDAPAARHGLSLALADAAARRAGVPLAGWLGDDPAASVPVNATVGDGDRESTVGDAEAAVADGFDCLKVKVGARSLDADLDRLRAVREACPDAALRADANGAWDRDTAREAVDVLADLDLAYLEQPLAAGDVAGHAALREHAAETGGGVAVALDESLAGSAPERLLDADAADVLVLKPMALGGVDRAREAALTARERGVDAVVTTTIDAVVARTGAVHLAASLPDVRPCGLATAGLLGADLASDPAPVERGRIAVPEGKGNVAGRFTSDSA